MRIKAHKATAPAPGTYQAKVQKAMEAIPSEYGIALDQIEFQAWKADHQVKALKDKITWLESLLDERKVL